jgi:hypothetical protein
VGRRAGIGQSERVLRAKFAEALWQKIGTARGAQSAAAHRLGVSRQAINLYLYEKATPGSEVLRRAIAIWNLSLVIEGVTLDSGSFGVPKGPRRTPRQTLLFNPMTSVGNEQLRVVVLKRSPKTIDLKVSIDLKRAAKR